MKKIYLILFFFKAVFIKILSQTFYKHYVIIVCLKIFSLNIFKFVTRITLYWLHMVTINYFYIITTKLIVYIF